ncbi:hypothetical protein PINS_up007578 [Pythium insidiosum]|nr:hypothetical protein PINS_up007578 [Pythium insidiosum]
MGLCQSSEDNVVLAVKPRRTARRVDAQNAFPIILVHGFAGQPVDANGTQYWGRRHGDFADELRKLGHDVFVANIGPLSSNWDRACELYAQIKGGRVDYGANHSDRFGHERFGRTYPGLYPQWGETVDGQVCKVHLVGHSMGGTTSRMLAQLLAHGTDGAPTQEDATSHPLFTGGKHWVHSITTISTPNQGSTLVDAIETFGDAIEDVVATWFAVRGAKGEPITGSYDAQLDQWSLQPRRKNESVAQYIRRVFKSKMFAPGFQDSVVWSLSTTGARAENAWVTTLPSVFYFSVVNHCSMLEYDANQKPVRARPKGCASFELSTTAAFIGSSFTTTTRKFPSTWLANDGAVNAASMVSDGRGPVVAYEGVSTPGHWMTLPPLLRMDHTAIVGSQRDVNPIELYVSLAALLADLPVVDGDSAQRGHSAPDEIASALLRAIKRLNGEKSAANDASSRQLPVDTSPCAMILEPELEPLQLK